MTANPSIRARVIVSGRVQGVAYRAFAHKAALREGLCGGVRNLKDGRVEVEVEGNKQAVEEFIKSLKAGPPLARVDDLQVQWEPATGQYSDFRIWYS
ncbi:MAG: acylphosphatase [Nitrospiraceae bacterium]